jgi:L-fucose mutarotase/ribose pyranase (RbsD/FucU family)
MKTINKLFLIIILMNASTIIAQNWKQTLHEKLPLLGHRNWIVVVDAAYPAQTTPGITTILCDEPQEQVVKTVVEELAATQHVRPVIYLDKELQYVAEKNAPGIINYRNALNSILSGSKPEVMLHENIISMLDEAGKTFNIIVLKTKLTLPYTSVFFKLECGYWTDEAEKQLRTAMAK